VPPLGGESAEEGSEEGDDLGDDLVEPRTVLIAAVGERWAVAGSALADATSH